MHFTSHPVGVQSIVCLYVFHRSPGGGNGAKSAVGNCILLEFKHITNRAAVNI